MYVRRTRLSAVWGLALLLWLSVVSGWAGLEEGAHAYRRGDYAAAFVAWLPLAQQGDAGAQFLLGALYAQGRGVPQDYSQAAEWFRRAAEQGDANAQHNLGLMYASGVGVPQDHGAAYVWLTLAATHMSPGADRDQAVQNRDIVAARLTPPQLAEAQTRVRLWQAQPATPAGEAPGPPQTRAASQAQGPSRIRHAQERLKMAGFDPGVPDGTLGPKTRDALRRYQRARGLPTTGELDAQTLEALNVR